MDITLLPPTHILAHHSHLTLLPSAIPNYSATSSSFNQVCQYGRQANRYTPQPPKDGSSPFSNLPPEIILTILSNLEFSELIKLLGVSKHLYQLVLSPSLHRKFTLNHIPTDIPQILKGILPLIRELTISLNPYPSYRLFNQYENLLSHKRMKYDYSIHRYSDGINRIKEESILKPMIDYLNFDRIKELNIPFSSTYIPIWELESILERLGNRLIKLDLRGSSLHGTSWTQNFEKFIHMKKLDLGFTNITSLPSPTQFLRLKNLNLSSCDSLPSEIISNFLAELPSKIEILDLSRLEQIDYQSLLNLRVTYESEEGDVIPTRLEEIKLVGIDHLTRRDIRSLKKWWEKQRRDCCSIPKGDEGEGNELVDWRNRELKTPEITSRSSSSSSSSSFQEIRTPSSTTQSLPSYSPGDPISRANRKIILPTQHIFLQSLSSSPTPFTSKQTFHVTNHQPIKLSKTPKQPYMDDKHHEEISINIIHSAILESEDEDGYRRFIGEVVGGTLGLDVQLDDERGERRYVEIDQ